jgi:7-cyano-7-deazaguanine synthase
MAIVSLVSGGLDSSLMSLLAKENDNILHPLFINYGQLAYEKEWLACQTMHHKYGLPVPTKMDIDGYGKTILSGLTSKNKEIKDEAFLPGRNLVFLVMGAAYAKEVGATAVAIGLLKEETAIFNDQTDLFLEKAQGIIQYVIGEEIQILTPLRDFYKQEVVELAKIKGLEGTYSCHAGGDVPCEECIACEEYHFKE